MFASLLAISVLLADPAQLDCPLTTLSAPERAGLASFFEQQGPNDDPRFVVLRGATAQCGTRFGWAEGPKTIAFSYAAASAAVGAMRGLLQAESVDVDAIERLVLADPSLRGLATGSPQQGQAIEAFARRNISALMAAAGSKASDMQVMTRIGAFLAGRVVMESARADFARD
jgi:hypothetical protein